MQSIRNENYHTRLLQLGIPPAIMPTNMDYGQAYKALGQAIRFSTPKLMIKDIWQLICFDSSNLLSEAFLEEHKNARDNWGNSIVHYASWAGRIDVLNWFRDRYPKQLLATDNYGRNPSHYAAWSGCLKTLTWFKNYYPAQLLEKDVEGANTSHYAAWSGCADALAWFKDHYPEQLLAKDNDETSLSHYATWSGCTEALAWVKDHYPEQLLAKDNYGRDITIYASISGSTQQLETALSLSQYPDQFAFQLNISSNLQEKSITTFLSLLETNYAITKVINLEAVKDARKDLINVFLERNKAIAAGKLSFVPFTHQACHTYWPSHDIKMSILKHLLPPDVDICRVYQSLLPRNRLLFILQEKVRELVSLLGDHKNAALRNDIAAFSGLITLLQQLPELAEKETILKQIEVWQKVQSPSPTISQFFKTKESENPLQWLSLIKGILNNNDEELNNQPTCNIV